MKIKEIEAKVLESLNNPPKILTLEKLIETVGCTSNGMKKAVGNLVASGLVKRFSDPRMGEGYCLTINGYVRG